MDPLDSVHQAGSSPAVLTNIQTSKRPASSPLTEDERKTRQRTTTEQQGTPSHTALNTNNATSTEPPANEPENVDDNTTNIAINNQFFPTFKILRKLNNKLVTAQHHRTFLSNLKENGQVPKGLQVKTAPTGAELDLDLLHDWEEAHISLANTLRDILIKHWIYTETHIVNQITEHTERLRIKAPPEQVSLILRLIEKANSSKATELSTRRRRKNERTGTSAGGGPPPNPPNTNQAM